MIDTVKMFLFCFKSLRKQKIYTFLFYILTIVCGGISLLVPMINSKVIDCISFGNERNLLLTIKYFFSINLLFALFSFIKNKIYIIVQTNSTYNIIENLLKHLQKISISHIEQQDLGSLNEKINNDSNTVTSFIIKTVGDVIINFATLLFSIYILIELNGALGILMLFIGFIYCLIYLLLRKNIYKLSFKLLEEQATFFSAMLMQLNHIKFIKIHSLIDEYQKKMSSSYQKYYESVIKSQNFFYLYSSLDAIITIFANTFVFIVGGNLVITKEITIGEFTIILSYFNYIISSFKYFSSLAKEYQETKVSYTRLIDLFNIEEEEDGSKELSNVNSISCVNVSIKRNGRLLFSNFNYNFLPGSIYCICGENGKGKTSLIDTIIGIHNNEYNGKILFNNIPIHQINMYQLRYECISYMDQVPFLIEGNLRDNILLTQNHSFKNIEDPLTINISEINNFNDSIKLINSDGSGISGGEAQKLALYRMFAKKADVYILDEPTASLDQNSINKFMNYLNKVKKDKIIIIISHNLTTIQMCDYVIDL